MKRLLNGGTTASLAALCLITAGCDSKGTKEVKQEAKAIDESYKAQADLVEATAKDGPNASSAENKAQALRDQGQVEKKYLIKQAEKAQSETK